MRDLNYSLKVLLKEEGKGAYATRAAKHAHLQQAANDLHDLGYRKMTARSLKPKHVDALIAHWHAQALRPGTIKNRMSSLRWWAKTVGKPSVIARSNDHYGIDRRQYVTGDNKAKRLDRDKLDQVTDRHTRFSLQLQAAFGLRREEAIKFSPSYAVKADKIVLKGSWCKGGKPREIPIRNQTQRDLLQRVRQFVGFAALIPVNKNYVQQMRTYERNTDKAGLNRMHGLRHAYAQERYKEMTGWESPHRGGPDRSDLSPENKAIDEAARLAISREMGHERIQIVAIYLG